MLEASSLARFNAVFQNNTIGDLFGTPARRIAFRDFIRKGGGLVANHAATVTATDWTEFGEIPGARGASHRVSDEKVTVHIDDPAHPVAAAFEGRSFDLADEFFRFQAPYSRDKVRVILSIDTAKTDMNQGRCAGTCIREDGDYAISWIHKYGEGRIFYSTIGHNAYVFWHPQVLGHFLAGVQFALGDLNADASPLPARKPQ
jgi:type 1 glutamine amidotransferase